MPSHKTSVDPDIVLTFVHEEFDAGVTGLEPLVGGELSAAYSFVSPSRDAEFVARVNWRTSGFEKDDFAYRQFSSPEVSIPETHLIAPLDERLFVSVTSLAPGKTVDRLPLSDLKVLLPVMLDALDAVHTTNISGFQGFGYWDKTGNGLAGSWRDALQKDMKRVKRDLDRVYTDDHSDRRFHRELEAAFDACLEAVPEKRQLVHGDFGYDNLLAKDDVVTGVIDWDRSLYGDPLYDVAWIDFWPDEIDFATIVRTRYEEAGTDVAAFEERLKCYSLVFGLDALRFYEEGKRPEAAAGARMRLERLL